MDMQLVIVALAAICAALYAGRAVWRQFQRPDDEPHGCHGCPANRGSDGSPDAGRPMRSGSKRPLRLLALPVLLAALFQGSPVRAHDVNEWLSVGGVLSATGQCQILTRGAGASDVCGGTLPVQPELSVHPTESDEFFFKVGFAGGNGLSADSPFPLAPWAADLQDDVKDIHGR